MKPSSLAAAAALLSMCTLAGCSHAVNSSAASARPPGPATPAASPAAAAPNNQDCTGGLAGNEPGVARITCNGSATIRVRVGSAGKDFHGGECRSAGDIWSAAAGVVIDATGMHGKYRGPSVDSIAVNNTDSPGKGTIQVMLNGKHYYDLGEAKMTLTDGGKKAHLQGTSHQLSDAPGAKITVDVTC
jgi:hypothetical protein